MPSILILGETGQLARTLCAIAWPAGFHLACLGHAALGAAADAGPAAAAAIRDRRPHLVLNAAAYTAVDRAESEPLLAHALNADLPLAIAGACGALRVPLVHVSTDYVFDGLKPTAYVETDPTSPLNVYGASKLAGDRNIEAAMLAAGEPRRWSILRSSWIFSEIGDTFPAKLLRRARAGETLRVVDDQVGCPTPVGALAGALQAIGLRLLDGDAAAAGLFNFCGAEAMSWHGFARRLLDAAQQAGLAAPPLQAVSSDQFPTAAKRPRRSVLDCAKIAQQCGLAPAAIDGELDRIVRAVLAR